MSLETLPFIRGCHILACLSLARPGRSPVSFCAPAQRHCQSRTPCSLYATGTFPGSRRLDSWRRFTTKCSEEFVPTVPPLILNGTPLTAGGPAFAFFPLLDPGSWVLDPSSLPALVWASLRPYFLSSNPFNFQDALTLYNSPFTVRFGMSAHTLPQRPALGSSHRRKEKDSGVFDSTVMPFPLTLLLTCPFIDFEQAHKCDERSPRAHHYHHYKQRRQNNSKGPFKSNTIKVATLAILLLWWQPVYW